ncbi:MAG: tetratricopeptide repeat protein [Cystobacter sp.]
MSLKAEVRLLRETQGQLEKRLERMELLASANQARAARAASAPAETPSALPAEAPAAPPSSGIVAPGLSVVKLKPRSGPAPSLPVRVGIVEPSSEDMEVFVSAGSDGDEASQETAASTPAASDDGLEAVFQQAVSALRTGNVEGGVAELLGFADQNPRHSRADNALYFSGIGQMGLKDYALAAQTFERLIARYPAGDAVLDGMLRLAECRLRLERKDDARALYTRILTQFPGTAAATQAEQRLATLSP